MVSSTHKFSARYRQENEILKMLYPDLLYGKKYIFHFKWWICLS